MRRVLLAAVFLVLAAPAGGDTQTSDSETCEQGTGTRATVIVIWGPGGAAQHCQWLARHGYRTRAMPSLPPKWSDAWRMMVNVTRRAPAPRYVYGWSRAGAVAELLVERGKVDGAIAVAAPSDLTRWWNQFPEYWESSGMTMEDRRRRSPLFNVPDHPLRLLLAHAPEDHAVPFWHSRKLHRRVKGSILVRLAGDHTDDLRGVRRASLSFLADAVRDYRESRRGLVRN